MLKYSDLLTDIIEWDIYNWGVALSLWDKEIEEHLNLAGNPVKSLEIGARNGGLSLYLSLKGFSVICTDLEKPTEKAREMHKKYGVSNQITYEQMDVTDIRFSDNFFDIVIFKSLLGGVGRNGSKYKQEKAIGEIYRVLKPGGLLLFAENLRGSVIHMFLRKKFVKWGDLWRYITIDEMKEFTSQFSVFCYRTFGFLALCGRSNNQRRFLHLIDSIINPFIPKSAKYIIYGCAKK